MLLTIDAGNTNITIGAYDGEILQFTARLSTDHTKTGDQYAIDIKDLLELYGCDYTQIDDCIIATVVPNVGMALKSAVTTLCNIIPIEVGPGIKTGLNIKIDNPAQLGADMVAGAVGAIAEYTLPCVVIDMGTATTFSVIDENSSFIGGIITAGIKLSLRALSSNTAQLPSVAIEAPKSVIGTNTIDCMKSGLVLGAAAMLDGLLDRIEEELGITPTVVATGGLSRDVVSNCRWDIIYNENLLLDGLKEIYEKNRI